MTSDSGRVGTSCAPSRRVAAITCGAILVLAFALRAWRIGWGLDRSLAFPDEPAFWQSYLYAFAPSSWQSPFGHSLFYPPLYGYLSGIAVALGRWIGWIGPERDLFAGLLVARWVSVLASVATVVVTGRTGARIGGLGVGLLAAALTASIPLEAMQTHYASCDPLLCLTIALVCLASCAFTRDRDAWRAAACGASVGLAFATKYNAIVFGAAPAWVVLEVAFAERSARRVLTLAGAVLAGFVVATVIACPPWLFETRRLLGQMRWINFMSTVGNWLPANNHVSPDVGWYGSSPYLYRVFASLPFALGWPLWIAAMSGVALALWRRDASDRVLLAGAGAYFVLLGQTNVSFARYVVPLLPVLAILAARLLHALPLRREARVPLAAAIVAYGAALGFSQVARFSYDQQVEVARWIRERFPADAWPELSVVVPAHTASYFQLQEPLAREGLAQRNAKAEHWLDDRPEVFVLPEWYATAVRRDRARAGQRVELDRLETGAAGYTEAARWSSRYLQQDLYTRLDPAFASDLYMGAIGFRVYVRDDLVTRDRAPGAGPR